MKIITLLMVFLLAVLMLGCTLHNGPAPVPVDAEGNIQAVEDLPATTDTASDLNELDNLENELNDDSLDELDDLGDLDW